MKKILSKRIIYSFSLDFTRNAHKNKKINKPEGQKYRDTDEILV